MSILPGFQENLQCVQNWRQNEFGGILKSYPPGYVEINGKLSPIPQICILKATILAESNYCQFSQFSKKIYIVYKIGPKMSLVGF